MEVFDKLKHPNIWFRRGLMFLAVLVFFLITVGGWVRNMGAGLSCPDWPLCNGKIIPHFDALIFAEYFHRVVAGSVSLLTLGFTAFIFTNKKLSKLLGRQAILALIILASQVVLGGLTVLKILQSEIVTLHLIFGTLFFAVILVMNLRLNRFGGTEFDIARVVKDKLRKEPSHTWRWALTALLFLFLQILLGGVVSSHYAGLACPDFPTCQGQWWPGLNGVVGIQVLHRIGACLAFIAMTIFVFAVAFNRRLPRHIQWKARFVAIFSVVQIILGIANVLLKIPIATGVAHLAVAEILFALILISAYEIRHFELR